jgi:hypothetical protein
MKQNPKWDKTTHFLQTLFDYKIQQIYDTLLIFFLKGHSISNAWWKFLNLTNPETKFDFFSQPRWLKWLDLSKDFLTLWWEVIRKMIIYRWKNKQNLRMNRMRNDGDCDYVKNWTNNLKEVKVKHMLSLKLEKIIGIVRKLKVKPTVSDRRSVCVTIFVLN